MAGAEAGAVVVVDFPKNAVTTVVEAAEVVFSVRVIVFGEAVERSHTLRDG